MEMTVLLSDNFAWKEAYTKWKVSVPVQNLVELHD